MSRRRKLGTLSRADIGKRITFTCACKMPRHVEGVIRAFTHGVFSHESAGEIDAPRVMVTIAPQRDTQIVVPFGSETHWATPETSARLAADVENTKEGRVERNE